MVLSCCAIGIGVDANVISVSVSGNVITGWLILHVMRQYDTLLVDVHDLRHCCSGHGGTQGDWQI